MNAAKVIGWPGNAGWREWLQLENRLHPELLLRLGDVRVTQRLLAMLQRLIDGFNAASLGLAGPIVAVMRLEVETLRTALR